ncbi:fungal-specific transcription factor domain-containing protein [Dichotomopilus funicola]|uniref:Fungal-specific transcription factor domain-containing protein n=1 Tax=Dichotomopilus funicola TaxID=1934379 RepID=A0AAN6ZMH8_9PEZI|nr:fungal-specific transcription factor domain-containing protein [Dichotomopilus funicola]
MASSNIAPAASCFECRRRKQKVKKGKKTCPLIACRTHTATTPALFDSYTQNNGVDSDELSRKRSLDSSDRGDPSDEGSDRDDSGSDIDVSGALNGLGYPSHHHHLVLGQGPGPKVKSISTTSPHAPSPLAYCLVDNWLNGANHQYYALYPPEFRTQYDGWWTAPRNKATPELTSLILRVCACSLHFIIDDNVRVRLERELNTDVLTLADRMHAAAEKLSTTIPPGKGGLVNVQQLFLTAFWLKSAEKWTEAWHALGRAIRAANEIGLHQDSFSEGLSEYDREMRRRVWVILYLWDFALGSMLSRPLQVNQSDCTVVMPTLTLENYRSDQPSPFRHMNLHCQLCIDMAAQVRGPTNSETEKAEAAKRMTDTVDKWLANLPAEYAVKNPETRWDGEFDWVVFQRRYLHLIGYMGLFTQLRPFVTRSSATPGTELEEDLRSAGVDAALGLMEVSWRLFESLVSVGAKFHYAIFCIFDAATVMCSAFLQDEARTLPQRETVLEAIKKCLGMLAEVAPQSKTTAALYRILKGLIAKLPLNARELAVVGSTKRVKNDRVTPLTDKSPNSTSPTVPSSQRPRGPRRDPKPRHRSTSASSDSDSTLDSSNFQPRSESSVSLPDSCRSANNARIVSDAQARPRSVVPSNAVAPDGLPAPTNFVPPTPVHTTYPPTTGGYMPPASSMAPNVYMSPDSFPPGSGFVQEGGFPFDSAISPAGVGAIPFSQPGWHPSQGPPIGNVGNHMNMYQDGTVPPFQNAEVLHFWEWQSLQLGHPMTWGQQLENRRHPGGLPGTFMDRGMSNDCGESASTELSG